jgi:hypothetical protein
VSLRLVVAAVVLAVMPPAIAAPGGQVVRVEHYDPSTTPARGPTNALVTVELFFAPSVTGSTRMPAYRQLEALQQRHPTRVRIIYRIVQRGANPPGPQLPTLALEAYAQGKFFEFIAAVHAQRMSMTRDQMLEMGKKVGLDPQRAERAIVDDRYHEVIDANERRLERLRGTSSPMVFFNSKPARSALTTMSETDYENAYLEAYDRAREMLDKGIERKNLLDAFDAEVLQATQPLVITAGPTDDELETESSDHQLASPPLSVEGLPSFGQPDATAPVPVILLCRPNDASCNQTMRVLNRVHNTYRGEIRLVWAPWFEVAREDAAELTMLGDAALCAEKVGSSPDDLDASPGWQWVTEAYTQQSRAHGRRITPDKLIDSVSAKQGVDTNQLSACRARLASATLDWITAARRSGVTSSPSVVIGGRIYPGLNDPNIIQQLVEAELAPGVLGRCATTGC